MLDNRQEWHRRNLLSGVMYRVRVCALNSCGRSKFSDHCSYKTIVPGFPGAPSSIKGKIRIFDKYNHGDLRVTSSILATDIIFLLVANLLKS